MVGHTPPAELYRLDITGLVAAVDALVIYHDHCVDGAAAYWAVERCLEERGHKCAIWEYPMDYQPGDDWQIHRGLFELARGKAVFIVDFCMPAKALSELEKVAASVLVIDHHLTALRHLEAWMWPGEDRASQHLLRAWDAERRVGYVHNTAVCGSELTWIVMAPDADKAMNVPLILRHVGDRDTWRFKLKHTREIHARLALELEYAGSEFFDLMDDLSSADDGLYWENAIRGGTLLRRADAVMVETIADSASKTLSEKWGDIWHVACPKKYASDVGHVLAERNPRGYSITWWDDANKRTWSLRSAEEGVDVSKIAQSLGGGGHRHAAGFVSYPERDTSIGYIINREVA